MSVNNGPPVVNPIPPAILVIFCGIISVEAALFFGFLGSSGNSGLATERLFLIQNYGVPPNLVNWMFETGNFSFEALSRFLAVSYTHLTLPTTPYV